MIFQKKETISNLDDVLNMSWKLLHQGVRNFRDPFHTPALSTLDHDKPEVRTVVLRHFSERDRTLICHCDARTAKISQIQNNSNVSWLFYHPKKWIQIRLSGTASIHTDDSISELHWKKVRKTSRINYCATPPPGSPVDKPASGLPNFIKDKTTTLFDNEKARKNYSVIVCSFDQMDWLMLKVTGNIRAKFRWTNNCMDASWIVP